LFKEWLPQLHGASPSAALDESYEVVFMIARHRLSVKVILIFGQCQVIVGIFWTRYPNVKISYAIV
jgi:hypothetical protein